VLEISAAPPARLRGDDENTPDEFVWTTPAPNAEIVSPEVVIEVNAPVLGVVDPIAPGEAKVAPFKLEALTVPEPVKFKEAPDPTTIAACVLVPEVITEKAGFVALFATQDGGVPLPFDCKIYPTVPGAREVIVDGLSA
jgi:hypothetical protein